MLPMRINTIDGWNITPSPDTGSYWSGGECFCWTVGTLNGGQCWTGQFTVSTSGVSNGDILRSYILGFESSGKNATAFADTRIGGGLNVSILAEPRELSSGETLRFKVIYSNQLSIRSGNTALRVRLPDGIVPMAASAGYALDGNILSWDLASIASGEGGTLEIVAQAPAISGAAKPFTAHAEISEQFGSNASCTASTIVRPTYPLIVTLDSSTAVVSAGGYITYTASIVNTGVTPISGVVLRAMLPTGINSVSSSQITPAPDSGSYWSGGGYFRWTVGTLTGGQRWTGQFTVRTNSVSNGDILRSYVAAFDSLGQHGTALRDVMVGNTLNVIPAAVPAGAIRLTGDLGFGQVIFGLPGSRVLTIHNDGATPLFVLGIDHSSPVFSGNFSGFIPAFGSQNVTVRFAPTAAIAYSDSIYVSSNATSGSGDMRASGAGAPVPTRIISIGGNPALGPVVVGATLRVNLTLYNSGNTALTLRSIVTPAGFTVTKPSSVIPAHGSMNVTVAFSPKAARIYDGTLIVYSNATAGVGSIRLRGTGTSLLSVPVAPTRLILDKTTPGLTRDAVNISFSDNSYFEKYFIVETRLKSPNGIWGSWVAGRTVVDAAPIGTVKVTGLSLLRHTAYNVRARAVNGAGSSPTNVIAFITP